MVVGVVGNSSAQAARRNFAPAKVRLEEMGWLEGRNLAIEYYGADDQLDRLPLLIADLVKRRAAVIVAASGPVTAAAKAATKSIPIIFFTGFDPQESGFVKSLNRPGGNVTGVFILGPELIFKRLEFLHELVPTAKTMAFLFTQTAIQSGDVYNKRLQEEAERMGVKLFLFSVSDASQIDESFERAVIEGVGAVIVQSDPVFLNNRQRTIALAARHRLPAIYFIREYAAEGGLISYGPDYTDVFRQLGDIIGRVLNGEKTEELPVRRATKIDLVVNMKTSKSLGLAVPLALLGRADEVIE
jgi:putative ABC transport system substrate-binding protein